MPYETYTRGQEALKNAGNNPDDIERAIIEQFRSSGRRTTEPTVDEFRAMGIANPESSSAYLQAKQDYSQFILQKDQAVKSRLRDLAGVPQQGYSPLPTSGDLENIMLRQPQRSESADAVSRVTVGGKSYIKGANGQLFEEVKGTDNQGTSLRPANLPKDTFLYGDAPTSGLAYNTETGVPIEKTNVKVPSIMDASVLDRDMSAQMRILSEFEKENKKRREEDEKYLQGKAESAKATEEKAITSERQSMARSLAQTGAFQGTSGQSIMNLKEQEGRDKLRAIENESSRAIMEARRAYADNDFKLAQEKIKVVQDLEKSRQDEEQRLFENRLKVSEELRKQAQSERDALKFDVDLSTAKTDLDLKNIEIFNKQNERAKKYVTDLVESGVNYNTLTDSDKLALANDLQVNEGQLEKMFDTKKQEQFSKRFITASENLKKNVDLLNINKYENLSSAELNALNNEFKSLGFSNQDIAGFVKGAVLRKSQDKKIDTVTVDGSVYFVDRDAQGNPTLQLGMRASFSPKELEDMAQKRASAEGISIDEAKQQIMQTSGGAPSGGGSIAVTHNNPANIKYGDFAKRYGATAGKQALDGGVFAVFPSLEVGLQARQDLLKGQAYADLTVDSAMKKWSNNGYGGEIMPEISNKKISDLTPEEFNKLTLSQIKREDNQMYNLLTGQTQPQQEKFSPLVMDWAKKYNEDKTIIKEVPENLKNIVMRAEATLPKYISPELLDMRNMIGNMLSEENKGYLADITGPVQQFTGGLLGGKATQLRNQYNQVLGYLQLLNAGKIKGQGSLSDAERKILRESSTSLNRNLDYPLFKEELKKVYNAIDSQIPKQTYTITPTDVSWLSEAITAQIPQADAKLKDEIINRYSLLYQAAKTRMLNGETPQDILKDADFKVFSLEDLTR